MASSEAMRARVEPLRRPYPKRETDGRTRTTAEANGAEAA
jgi:hypothetical protein